MEKTQPFRHLLLDLDGTLIHSGNFLTQLDFVRRILPELKTHTGWRSAWRALKAGNASLKIPSQTQTNHQRFVSVFADHFQLSSEEAEKKLFQVLSTVFETLQPHFGQIDGARAFIDWAKHHYTLTLTTNPVWPRSIVEMRMRWGGIDPSDFKSITTIDRMHATKPSLDYYREVLTQENFEAKDCLLIGNERKMDLPATGAGVSVFLIRPKAKHMTQIGERAWRGNYEQLKAFLDRDR